MFVDNIWAQKSQCGKLPHHATDTKRKLKLLFGRFIFPEIHYTANPLLICASMHFLQAAKECKTCKSIVQVRKL